MPYQTILVPTEPHDLMTATLETALLLARRFNSYMEGFAVHPAAGTYVAVEPVSSLAISGAYEHDAELASQARTIFENFMRGRDVPAASGDAGGYSHGWPRSEAEDDLFIGSYGRLFDLIVLGRPGRAQRGRMAFPRRRRDRVGLPRRRRGRRHPAGPPDAGVAG